MSKTVNESVKNYQDVEIDLKDEELIKRQTMNIIQDLRPNWNADNVQFNTFSKGITNRVYRVTHKSEPEEHLVFRIFGKNTEKVIDRSRELETICRLEKVGLAAPLHAKLKNGIVCGYLEGETLTCQSVKEPKMMEKICEAMAKMHHIPLEPTEKPFIFTKMRQFLDNIPSFDGADKATAPYKMYYESNDLQEQCTHLQHLLTALDAPVVFCHNDLLINNILYDEKDDKVHFIDYEYGDANYQLFEIANHFCEYAGVDDPDYSLCPSLEGKKTFLTLYLKHYLKREPVKEEVDATVAMLPFFEAASHFFWALWALVQASNSTIDFDYLKYSVIRHRMFATIVTRTKRLSDN